MLLIIGLILGAGAVIFAFQNVAPVTVSFIGWHFDGSLALIILFAVLLGMLLSVLFSLPSYFKTSMQQSELKRNNQKLSRELDEHKVMLHDAHTKIAEASKPPVIIEKTIVVENPPLQ